MSTLQQLRVLLAVREHGNLTQAAAALHHQVPTVTHHIRTLEAHFGALARQRPPGTRITPLGEGCASAARFASR